MAARTNRVEVEIVAIDEASPKIEKLEKRIDGLESDEARIIVTASMERLDKQLTDALAKMRHLEGDELTVQARLVGSLEQDLIDATKLFDQLDGQTGTVRIDADTTGAVQHIDTLNRSAEGGRNALANMVGNTTQDLGTLGGIAGSAGVAIGQMAEYASDAALATGGLRAALVGMSAVLGPIAAISAAMLAIQDIMGEMAAGQAATKAFDTKQVEQFTEAIQSSEAAANAYNETLTDTGEVLADTGLKAGPAWTQILPPLNKLTDALGLMGKFGSEIENILPLLNRAGIDSDIWTQIITSDEPVEAMNRLRSALELTNLSDSERSDILVAARAAQDNYSDAVSNGTEINKFFTRSTAEATAATRNFIEVLRRRIGLSVELARAKRDAADEILAERDAVLADAAAAQQMADDFQDAIAATIDFKGEVSDATVELGELAAGIDELEAANLEKALDTGDTALDTLGAVQDINQGIRDLAEFIKSPDGLAGAIPDIFDPNDVNADDFLAKFASLRGPIQEQVARVLGEAGPSAAQAMADSFVKSLSEQTGLTPDDIRHLLGLEDLEAKIRISIEQTEIDKARTQLELLEALLSSFPGAKLEDQAAIASIKLALDAGTITGEQAQALIQPKLRDFGVVIPTELAVPDTDKVRRDAQTALNQGQPVTVPVMFQTPTGPLNVSGLVPSGGSVPTINVTNNLPPGTPADTVHSTVAYYDRNGNRVGP